MTEAELPDDPFPVKVAKRARVQAYWCRRLGSPLYGDLIERVADDVEAGADDDEGTAAEPELTGATAPPEPGAALVVPAACTYWVVVRVT